MKTIKRISCLVLLGLFLLGASELHAQTTITNEHHEIKKRNRISKRVGVFFRGVVNIATLPLEIPRTFFDERQRNPENWEWSLVPRTFENVVGRGLSAVNDSVLYPFWRNSEDLNQPLSRQWNLPDYPWRRVEVRDERNPQGGSEHFTMIGVRG